MDAREIWPAFRDGWILYEDDALIAVSKPVGVPSQGATPDAEDDVVSRLREHMRERDGQDPYLGTHQRLDQETSGVLLYTKRREVNASVAAQMEGRTVDKRYVAVVTGWRGAARRLVHNLRKGSGGRMEVGRGGKRAALLATPLERSGDRTLLSVQLETGRTHQIRAQLAHEGCPVAGDGLYGGTPAPRLMLHAEELGLVHPVTGDRLEVRSPVPAALELFLEHGRAAVSVSDGRAFADAVARAVTRRYALGRAGSRDEATTAFRLINGAGDGLPGVEVDVYGSHLVLHRTEGPGPDEERVLDALQALGFDGIYVKRRPRQANVVVDARGTDMAPADPVRGAPAPDPLTILENGIPFEVRLGDGLSTGIFLDQRDNRRRVRELARGGRVLNLFSYTGGFSVAAAVGGARSTLSVDVAAPALARACQNLALSGFGEPHHRTHRADVFAFLDDLEDQGAVFDLVIVDPPTYSRTRRTRWTSGAGFRDLLGQCLSVLAPGGRLLAASNDRRMPLSKLRRYAQEAARQRGCRVAKMKDLASPPDHPPPPGGETRMKSLLLTLA